MSSIGPVMAPRRHRAVNVCHLDKKLIHTGTPQLRWLRAALRQAQEPLLEPERRPWPAYEVPF
jgi:hypothetical protein